MAANRVYVVENETEMTLVAANTPAQALGYVVREKYKVRTANAIDVVNYTKAGGEVEDATEKEKEEEEVEGEEVA